MKIDCGSGHANCRAVNCIFQASAATATVGGTVGEVGMAMAIVSGQGVMRDESDLDRLRRQVEKSKILVRQSEMKVEELEATVRDIYNFKDRLVIFPRRAKANGLAG